MSLYINHNMMAANAARNLSNIYGNLATSVQRLSSGLRINSAADDAAGLAVRELMRADIAVINQGVRNASDAISMIQTAEGAMSVIDEKLIRMKELAEQAATGTYTTAQRLIMDSEYQAMAAEIDRIATATDFNGIKLLDGSMAEQHDGSGLKVHFGTGNDAAEDYYFVSIGDMKATSITGLQVGGGGGGDFEAGDGTTWVTDLNMASADSLMPSGYYGVFGIQTSTDGTTWDNYGYGQSLNADSINSLAEKINAGSLGTNTIDLSDCSSTGLNGNSLTIGNLTYSFTTASSGVFIASDTNVTIGIQGYSLASIGSAIMTAGIGSQYVLVSTSTVAGSFVFTLWAGLGDAEDTPVSTTVTSIALGGANFINQPTAQLTAEAVQDAGGGWELQVSSDDGLYIRWINTYSSVYSANPGDDTGAPLVTSNSSLPNFDINMYAVSDFVSGTGNMLAGEIIGGPGADIQTQSAAQLALAAIDEAINRKDTARANLGALQNRLENTITNLQIQAENLQASESRISDVDVALEMTEFTRNNIMTQAAVSMLAQANSLPQLALQLLG